jgi:hypothetical protein
MNLYERIERIIFVFYLQFFAHSELRYQATDLHIFRLVGKVLTCEWFLVHTVPWIEPVECAKLSMKNHRFLLYRVLGGPKSERSLARSTPICGPNYAEMFLMTILYVLRNFKTFQVCLSFTKRKKCNFNGFWSFEISLKGNEKEKSNIKISKYKNNNRFLFV